MAGKKAPSHHTDINYFDSIVLCFSIDKTDMKRGQMPLPRVTDLYEVGTTETWVLTFMPFKLHHNVM